MMTDTAGTRTRDRPRRRAGGRRGGRHPQGHPPRRGRQRGDRRGAGRHAGPGDPGGLRPAPRLRPLPRAHSDDRHRGHRLLGGGPGPPPRGAAGAPTPGVIRPKRSQRRRGKSDPIDAYAAAGRAPARGRRPARGQDRHRPLRTDPGAPGLAPQRDEGPRPSPTGRSPPCRPPPPTPCAPAPHRLSGGELIDALARTRPAPATHRPRIGDRASAAPPGSAATGSRADEIADIDTELRALTARAAPTMLATKALRRQPPPPCSPAPATTPAESAPRHPSPPCAAPPRSPPAPGKTNRHRLNRGGDRQANREPHPNAPPARRPAHQGLRRPPHRHGQELQRDTALPQTRHRPPSTAPADPPPTRTPHRRPAPRAPRTRTHPPPKPPTTRTPTRPGSANSNAAHAPTPPSPQHTANGSTPNNHRPTPLDTNRSITSPPRCVPETPCTPHRRPGITFREGSRRAAGVSAQSPGSGAAPKPQPRPA